MATKTKPSGHAVQEKEAPDPKARDMRVDEFAFDIFRSLGYKNPLPDELVETYQDFKRTQDTLAGGRLTPEGFCTVIALSRINRQLER
jgi:hypothetical protein